MVQYTNATTERFFGSRYRDRDGKRVRESTFTEDWQDAQRKLRERLQARDDKLLEIVRKGEQLQFSTWVDFFLENYSQPPLRAEKTHEANLRAGLHLKKAFGARKLAEISADDIEFYLRRRLQDRVRIKTKRRCCPAREAETGHGSSGTSGLAPGSECSRAKEVAAFESLCRG